MVEAVTTEARIVEEPGGSQAEVFPLPLDEDFLQAVVTDIFERYWQRVVFGPMIQGAAYEIRCPSAPTKIGYLDGYLTIFFGRTHFHLCLGENKGSSKNPTPDDLRRHRRTSRAEFFRSLDRSGAPVSWGLRLFNGAAEPQMTIFFPNPFLSDDDDILKEPDWSRLAVWEEVMQRFTGRGPDPKDRSGKGFAHG